MTGEDLCPNDGRSHGTIGGYTRGCRGEPCKKTWREYQSGRRSKNREALRARERELYQVNRESVARRQKAARDANIEEYRAKDRARKARAYEVSGMTEERREAVRQWRSTPAGKMSARASSMRRRKQIEATDHGCVDRFSLQLLLDATDEICVYCGSGFKEFDHVHPLSRGGEHCVANLVPACWKCNNSKRAQILTDPPRPVAYCGEAALVLLGIST